MTGTIIPIFVGIFLMSSVGFANAGYFSNALESIKSNFSPAVDSVGTLLKKHPQYPTHFVNTIIPLFERWVERLPEEAKDVANSIGFVIKSLRHPNCWKCTEGLVKCVEHLSDTKVARQCSNSTMPCVKCGLTLYDGPAILVEEAVEFLEDCWETAEPAEKRCPQQCAQNVEDCFLDIVSGGAHVNASVTLAIFIGGGIKWYMGILYVGAQVLGSMAGAGLAYVCNGAAAGAFALGPEVSIARGVLAEIVLTVMLHLAVLMGGVELKSSNAAFAVGFIVIAAIMAGFGVSGGCMNPTLSFGPALLAGQWENYRIYWVCPLAGSIISGLLFRLLLSGDSRLIFEEELVERTNSHKMTLKTSSSEENDINTQID